MDPLLEAQVENFVHKIRHYLITTMGRTADEASNLEFYHAFSKAFREEIMVNWTATNHTFANKRVRKMYYLSMEYMPGKLINNNITNICTTDLVEIVLKRMNRSMSELLKQEPDVGIGNGGLGRLASCFLDSLASQNYPALGYGMRYQYGIFEQEVWCGVQVERPDCWLLYENPWEFRRDNHAVNVKFDGRLNKGINEKGEEIYNLVDSQEVRALPFDLPIIGYRPSSDFSVLTLRIWSTKESPRNFELQRFNAGQLGPAGENTALTDVLYPNDNNEMGKRIRLKQEFILSSASIQDIIRHHVQVFGSIAEIEDKVRIQINDTHPALSIAEMIRILITHHDLSWEKAFEVTKACTSYTNHTVLKEALEEWNEDRIHSLLPRQHEVIQRLNHDFLNSVREKYRDDEERVQRMSIFANGQIKMAHLAIYGSHHVNGVAALHTDILKCDMFKDFFEMYPEKFLNVTNGVTQRRWLLLCNPELSQFITERIGSEWILNFKEIERLRDYASDQKSQGEFLAVKKKCKIAFMDYLYGEMKNRHWAGYELKEDQFLPAEALFDIHIKRFHEYKRQLMNALHVLMLYQELKENPESRRIQRMVFFGGKAAPGYDTVKHVIRLIYCLSRRINNDPDVNQKLRLFFIENYNVSSAEMIIPAADLSEQISTAGMEASGTGNMKLSINGALTIGTDDGANVEMHEAVSDQYWPFKFGANAQENFIKYNEKDYNPIDIITHNPRIERAVNALRDGSLVENEMEHEALMNLYRALVEECSSGIADRYFVLNDLGPYYETQKRVEELFETPLKWAEYALQNIAAMGKFSSDESIHNYAHKIWNLTPCPPDPKELTRVRDEYSRHDKCRILPAKKS
ncbi:MAG: glycogen/starch/alpha-glucan family phosphorylase [Simkaniaceae bacterium]